MEMRVYMQTRHEIKHDGWDFEYGVPGLFVLLNDTGCDIKERGIEWEIEDELFTEAIIKIKEMDSDKVASYFGQDNIGSDKTQFKSKLTEMLERWKNTGDHRDGYYYLTIL